MGPEIVVRAAGVRDLPALVALWRELVAYHQDLGGQDFRLSSKADPGWRAYARGHLRKRDKFCLIAIAGAEPVGFILGSLEKRPDLFVNRRYGHISDAFVREGYRKRGVGTALTSEALRWFGARRIHRVRLMVDARNALGKTFWTQMGFRTTVHTMDRDI